MKRIPGWLVISSLFGLVAALLLSAALASCSGPQAAGNELLIALKPEAALLLNRAVEPDQLDTGIPSLDSLNLRWNVRRMVRVFPDVSPSDEAAARHNLGGIYKLLVPKGTDLSAMLREYEADPHVDYAELNQFYEIK